MRNLEIRKFEIRNSRRGRAGFTLIELMTVIGIITIISSVVIAAINPAQRLRQANDAARVTSISTIKNAVDGYTTLNEGTPPNCDGLPSCPTDYFKLTGSDALSQKILTLEHLKSIPRPPESGGELCKFYAKLYPSVQKKYELRWCFTSWNQQKVTDTNASGNYNCEWRSVEGVALCYAGTEEDIPVL